jgi:hypothetical protein
MITAPAPHPSLGALPIRAKLSSFPSVDADPEA